MTTSTHTAQHGRTAGQSIGTSAVAAQELNLLNIQATLASIVVIQAAFLSVVIQSATPVPEAAKFSM
jgi:hypothetical protein